MRQILKVFTLVFILCLLVILLKNEYARFLTKNSPYGIQTLISKTAKTTDLYIGSSMFRQGIDINVLEKKAKDHSWILAYNGNQPIWEQIILENLLNNNVEIRRIFLDMYAYSVIATPKVSDERLFLHTDFKTKLKFWEVLKTNGEASFNDFFQMFVSSNNEILWTWPLNKKLTDNRYLRGGNTAFNPGSTDSLIRSLPPVVFEDYAFKIEQRQALLEISRLCKQKNIELILIETPKYIEIALDKNYLEIMHKYTQLAKENSIPFLISETTAKELQSKDSSFSYLESSISFNSNDSESFQDRIHLSSKGRKLYTENLLKTLGKSKNKTN